VYAERNSFACRCRKINFDDSAYAAGGTWQWSDSIGWSRYKDCWLDKASLKYCCHPTGKLKVPFMVLNVCAFFILLSSHSFHSHPLQDPVLFSGTVKTNLDPFNEHSKDRLIDVLERVGLYSPDSSSPIQSLGDSVMQDGSNYSAGQRQLLVIARALLDGAAVVICDEATASIDAEADARIQRLLRQDFKSATTLTIAHRLNTIFDSTHILVMADGRAVEFDTPSALLSKGGLFKDLVSRWEEDHE
jgi:ABC-type multidrug transport system fused ATPase/permease subunit